MSDAIRINGNEYSWGSIKLKIGGELFTGFSEASYGDKRERVKGYGMGRHHAPTRRTSGKYSTDPVKLKGYKGSLKELRLMLAAQAADGRSYGNVEFEIVVQYIEEAGEEITDTLHRCCLVSDASSNTEGTDPLMDDVEADCMSIERNGLTLFDAVEGNP